MGKSQQLLRALREVRLGCQTSSLGLLFLGHVSSVRVNLSVNHINTDVLNTLKGQQGVLLSLHGTEYKVSEQVVEDLLRLLMDQGFEFYNKIPPEMQTVADGFSRTYLYKMEEKFLAKGMAKEEAAKVRPGKKEDASIKLLDIMLTNMAQAMNYVDVSLDVDEETNTIYSLSYGMSVPNGLQQEEF